MKKIIVNGKVLLGGVSGIERTSWEVLKQWDKIIEEYDELIIEIVVPDGYKKQIDIFKNINVVEFGNGKNLTIWQQLYLVFYVKKNKGIYLGFSNAAPFLLSEGIVLVHDLSCLINRNFYSKFTRFKFKMEIKHVMKKKFNIATVSFFSAKEICSVFGKSFKDILVLGNGWEHIKCVEYDDSIFEKNKKIIKGSYFFSLSSLAPNKNFKWIMNTAKLNESSVFVIGGGFKKEIYGNVDYDIPKNVVMLGRISDAEAKSLMTHCKAFIFPTLYEGFGIPPLEAYACGAVSIVSDTEVMHEIYGNDVAYVDVNKPCDNIDNICLPIYDEHKNLLKRHSWNKYSRIYLDYLYQNILF